MLRLLLPVEAGLRTSRRVYLAAPSISETARISLGPGSTALMLAVLGGSVEVLGSVFDVIKNSAEVERALLGVANADGETALRLAIYAAPGAVQELVLKNV